MNGAATRRARVSALGNAVPPSGATPESWLDVADDRFERARLERRRVGLVRLTSYLAIDVTLACLVAIVIYGIRFGFTHYLGVRITPVRELIHHSYTHTYPAFLLLYVTLIVMACMSQHLYYTSREISAVQESLTVVKAVGLATTLLVLFIFISGNKEISRFVVACSGAVNIATLAGWRYAKRQYILRRARRGEGVARALVIGAGKLGQTFANWLESNRQFGYVVCGFLDPHPNGNERVLGSIRDLKKIALEQFVDQLFLTLPTDPEVVKEIWLEARRLRLNLNVVPDIYDGLGWRAPIRLIAGFPVIELHAKPIPAFGLVAKRTIDIVLASLGLAVAAPMLALAAIWIRLDSRGPVIYSALRIGRKGKRFRCFKLRTMVDGADMHKEKLRETNERNGPFFKMENDPRLTRAGRWLRRFSIDELPQLVNVLRGEMSLVGPRPHPVDDYERYSLDHLRRLDVKPGVSGLWQVMARRNPSFETSMALDLEYIENWGLWLDLKILWRTVPALLRADGR